jgi:hypothetical protein
MKPAEERPTGRDIIQGEDKMKMCLKYRLRGSKVNGTGLESKQRPGLVLAVFTIQAVPVERCSTYLVVRPCRATTAFKNNF